MAPDDLLDDLPVVQQFPNPPLDKPELLKHGDELVLTYQNPAHFQNRGPADRASLAVLLPGWDVIDAGMVFGGHPRLIARPPVTPAAA